MRAAHLLATAIALVAADSVTTHIRVARLERRLADVHRLPVWDSRVDELVVNANELGRGLRICEARTTWLRAVTDVVVHEAAASWRSGRVSLPDPPPSWAAMRIEIPVEPKSWRAFTASMEKR